MSVLAEPPVPSSDEAIVYASIAETAKLIAAKKLSPVELIDAHLARIDALDGKVHSFITVLADAARASAREAEREIMAGGYKGPLHGIPYSLKDNYYTKGIRTTAASRVLWDWVPKTDATIHTRLQASGAILIGKNNTWEFGTGLGEAQPGLPFPAARNAFDLSYFAAGSSSGTGVASAAGFAMLGMGSDTGGSVRAPSAVGGLFGLKPTYGRLSRAGILPNSFSFDAAGPLVRNVRDAAIAMQAIAGHDPRDPTSARAPVPDYLADLDNGVKGLRIGYIRRFHERDVAAAPETVAALEAAVGVLKRLGAEIVEIDIPYSVQDCRLLVRLIGQAECLSIHEKDFRERSHLMGPALRDKFLGSISLSATDFVKATRWRQRMIADIDTAVSSVDAVISAGPMHLVPQLTDEAGRMDYMLGSANCVFNASGHPSAAVCGGYDSNGLPLSFNIAARYFGEATVMRVAQAYENARPWQTRRPSFNESPSTKVTPPHAPAGAGSATAPSRDEIAAILRRMNVAGADDAMIDRAHTLCGTAAGLIGRLPLDIPRDLDAAHILSLPQEGS